MGLSLPFHLQEPAASEKPWLVLIHGLGMSHRSWMDPFSEKLLNGALSFDYVLTDYGRSSRVVPFPGFKGLGCSPPLRLSSNLTLSFEENLKREGYGILTWSQRRSRGKIALAMEELEKIMAAIPPRDHAVLIGHSRGGLIARSYMQERRPGWNRIRALVLLGVPSHGSRIASLAKIFDPSPFFLRARSTKVKQSEVPNQIHAESLSSLIMGLVGYSPHEREGIRELVPGSHFLNALGSQEREERKIKIPYLNCIGTRSNFIRFYLLRSSPGSNPKPLFSLLDGLEKIIPKNLVPQEIKQGRGDGQVSMESAFLPWAAYNQIFPVNHAQFLVSDGVRKTIKKFLENI